MRGSARRPVVLGAFALLAILAASASAQSRQVTIQAQDVAAGTPLGYAVIVVPALGIERFTGASGAVVVPAPSGPLRVQVKRLGFEPRDTTLTITDAPTQSYRITLSRLSLRLGEVRVVAWPSCVAPGLPRRDIDPQSHHVVEQLRQNAERFDLLLKTYPFIYTSERVLLHQTGDSSEVVESVDTLLVSGDPAWSYRPGTLLRRSSRGLVFSTATYAMRLPSLRDFATRDFLDNHCFHVAGIEEKSGQRLLRMDIVAAQRLREPDVNVAVWLDTADYRIRFATLVLTIIPRQLRHLATVTSEITFLELLPYVPVMYVTQGENIETGAAQVRKRYLERQQMLDVRYLGPKPDDARPDSAATRPPPR